MLNTTIVLNLLLKKKIDELQRSTHQIISDFGQLSITKILLFNALQLLTKKYLLLQKLILKFNILLKNKHGLGVIDFLNGLYVKE